LVGGAAICCYGIVASASKGAFLSSFLAIFLWPVFCFREKLRRQWTVLIIIVALALPVALGIHWTMQNTVMGSRIQNGMHREDGSTQTRLKLSLIGLRLCLERPIFGWGLGEFPTASGTGMYAHNEWAELLGTTGVIGFLLYMSVYLTAWKRLTKALKHISNRAIRYHVNMARLIVILLVLSGALFRPNFLSVDSMFLIGLTVGVGQWAASHARKEIMEKRKRALRARWISLGSPPQSQQSVQTHDV
jgi:O-antigen ligase